MDAPPISNNVASSIDRKADALRCEEAAWDAALFAQWRDLERRSLDPTIFQTADWCCAWVDARKACGAAETPRIVTISRGSSLVLLWPLAVRRLSFFRVLHSLGEPATQYADALIDRGEDQQALLKMAWETIQSWPDIDAIELRRIRDGTAVAKQLLRHRVERTRASAPVLDFRSLDAGSAEGQRTSRTRQALRRHQRLLSEHGPVTFELVERPEEQCELLDQAFSLKQTWQKQKSSVSTGYAHGASLGCLQRLARSGGLLAVCLRSGPEIAAVEIGALRQRHYWSLVQSYDLRFSRHAPGRLLFWHLLKRCPELSIDVFDFLAPADRHKLEWSNKEVPIADYLVAVSLVGYLAVFYLTWVRPLLRECYRRLPAGLGQHASGLLRRMN